MLLPDFQARLARAGEICRRRGIGQAQIAEAVGASQSQISRILSGQRLRPSRLAEEICLFVERVEGGVTADAVRRNDELIEAVRTAWDGSAAHARALAMVIRSLAAFRPSSAMPSRRTGSAK